ncbi:alcohol dehydrogenase [Chiua virens]|nr:alcohol dehydrogenase [Chiua virens]
MAPVINNRILLKEFPTGLPVPGQTTVFDSSQTIDPDNVPLNGGVLLKTLVLSLEPYVFARMKPFMPNRHRIGEPLEAYGIGVVLRSENSAFQVGDHLHGLYPFREYLVQHEPSFTKVHNEYNLPWTVFLGVAGLPGKTAYFGWKEYSRAKKGEVAFVTSGAGAVGSFVIQLAKQDGMKVIASAGSDDKVQFLRELGADVAFNYKTTKMSEILQKEGPIDVYWDNVGGESLEAVLDVAATHARIIVCGMISAYGGSAKPISNLVNVIPKQISINGFVVDFLSAKYLETFQQEVPAQVASKQLIHREVITRGLENADVAFDDFLKGLFIGKSVVVLADE